MAYGRKKTQKTDDPLAVFRRSERTESDSTTVYEHEEEAARLIGGERHKGSGANAFLKSDASSEDYQMECKQTAGEFITLNLDWFKKITFEAQQKGKVPALHLRFLREMPRVPTDWVMVPAYEFERLQKSMDTKEEKSTYFTSPEKT